MHRLPHQRGLPAARAPDRQLRRHHEGHPIPLYRNGQRQGRQEHRGLAGHLESLHISGSKGLHGDLGRLKKLLQADPIDGEAVKALIGKMAEATIRIAGRIEGKRAADVEALGKALQTAG